MTPSMKTPVFYNRTAVMIAIVAIGASTATLTILSYKYTVGRENVVEDSLIRSNVKLVEREVDRIEQKIIDNDRSLYNMADVNEPSRWREVNDAIKKADLGVDQVWFLSLNGNLLYPAWSPEIKDLYSTFMRSFKTRELNLDRLRPDETNHLHKERREDYFFASYVIKENRRGEKILVCFQMNHGKILALLDRYLKDLRSVYYVSVVDYENNGVSGPPLDRVKYFHESRFPSTFYKWLLQVVPRNYSEMERVARVQRRTNFFFIIMSISLIFLSLVIIYFVVRRERQLIQLKADFIGNVSHELKTPLALIRMFSEILTTGRVKNDESKLEYYRIIHKESDRMSRLINNLLDFARLERGAQTRHFEKINIADLVKRELETYRYRIQKDGFQLVSRLEDPLPETLADAHSLTLAFFNLLDNSVKYSEDHKQITVSVIKNDGYIDLSVADQGLGIPGNEQQRIFEKFYRGSNAAVLKTRGSGIGLAITKHVAEMHGGEVLVESEPGHGSTFTLRIPIREAPAGVSA
jgi:two-component system phosphate regulon sensor histidine kinase PhoR